jgi:hypothetical protein
VLRPLVEDFAAVMRARGVLRAGSIRRELPAIYRQDAAQVRLVFRALGAARTRRYYEVRLTADVAPRGALEGALQGAIELSAKCVHYLPDDPRRVVPPEPPQALVELPALKTLSATSPDLDAARRWCGETLKQSAAAVVEATTFFSQQAAAAPLPAFSALAAGACPVMT